MYGAAASDQKSARAVETAAITETAAIGNLTRANQLIADLRELGCAFSLDDFGSGVSSFAYLKALTVDFLKIDGLFIGNIVHDRIDYEMLFTDTDTVANNNFARVRTFLGGKS